MITLLGWIAVAGAIAFVGWPFFRPAEDGGAGEAALPPLERQKLEAYAAIKEAEFDRRMGKLSDDDFAALTQRYRQQALAAIAATEQARAASARRATARLAFCPSCGARLAARANFCGACGRSLRGL